MFINNNGVFTVVIWYKRFFVNNKIIIAERTANGISGNVLDNNSYEEVQVYTGDISDQIVHITPNNKYFLDSDNLPGHKLNGLKFDVAEIENTTSL